MSSLTDPLHTRTCTSTPILIYTHALTHTHICTQAHTHARMHTHICACRHTSTRIHTHAHMHAQINNQPPESGVVKLLKHQKGNFHTKPSSLSSVFSVFQSGEELLPRDASGNIIFDTVDLRDTWEALEKCKDAGLTKSIGVSNFNRKLLELILNKPGLKYKPTCNQVECHPYLNQSKLLEFCKSKNIVLVAYSALASHRDPNWMDPDSPYLLEEPTLKSIAKKHSRSPGQVALRYQLQWGVVVLAKSFSEKRIKENFQVFDFELTPEDMQAIDGLNRNFRYAKLQL
uniref:NADP-dependent oxidoreductase domain-containing protein n=1 Tax=Papio anubis TaxID=9555 RepID=A0A8I5R135_PAPAN